MGPLKSSGRFWVLALALGLSAALVWWLSPALQRLNERSTDLFWSLTASAEPDRRVIVIDVDDRSLAAVGPWPWSPSVMASLVTRLRQEGAGLILFDVVFPQAREGTEQLGKALAAGDASAPAVMAQLFALRGESTLHIGQPVGAMTNSNCQPYSVPAQGAIANAPGLHNRAGHIAPAVDADGAIRRVPAIVCYSGAQYPALSLVALQSQSDMLIRPGQGPWQPAWWVTYPELGLPGIGLDASGHIRVPYRHGRRAYSAVAASDVLEGRLPPGMLRGAWVVVGASAFGLSDAIPTPLGPAVSGVEVHAQLLSAMLDGAVPFTPKVAAPFQWAYVLLAAFVLWVLVSAPPLSNLKRVVLAPVAGIALAGAAYVLHAFALWQFQWFVGWAAPALTVLVMSALLSLHAHAGSQEAKGRLFQNFASYVPSPVAHEIALQAPSGDIQAQRAEVTVLAADIRNFSAYCEARNPEDAARVLHRFYAQAGEIVAQHGGVVEEMVGDSLLAVFNGPQPCEEHPRCALLAAADIWLRCGEDLPNTSGQSLEPLAIGVGVETGTALVGSFGPAGRRVHTVLGQPVTIAIRLCGMTADLAYPILVGQNTAQRAPARFDEPDTNLKSLGNFLLPGLRHGSKIYTLRHLLEPNGPAERDNLEYLRHRNNLGT